MNNRAFITDLDGTLLRSDQTVSRLTVETLSRALDNNMVISFATARGYVSAMSVVSEIPWKYPLVLYNGALIYDGSSQAVIDGYWLDNAISDEIMDIGRKHGITPFYFSLDIKGGERVLHEQLTRKGETAFYHSRPNDPRFREVHVLQSPPGHRTLALTYIGLREELEPILTEVTQRLGPSVHSHIMKDYYIENHYFLEFSHPQANKKEGLKLWARHMNIRLEDIVVFGDNVNDLGLFEAGGLKIAVRNAHESIRSLADRTIASNDEDGVAGFIKNELLSSS